MNRGTVWAILCVLAAAAYAQTEGPVATGGAARPAQTMKSLARGADFAAASMMPQATLTAEQVLRAGGNAFDAVVAGQACWAWFSPHPMVSVATPCCWSMTRRRRRFSRLMRKARLPSWLRSTGIRSTTAASSRSTILCWRAPFPALWTPGTYCSRAGAAKTLRSCWRPRSSWPNAVSRSAAGAFASRAFLKYPTSMRVYGPPDGKAWQDGELWKNPDLARTFRRLVEAEHEAMPQGRQAALKAARDRFYKGDIAREMARFSEESGALFRYEDFAGYSAKVEEPVSVDYRGYTVYKNPSASQGPAELIALNLLEGYDLKKMGLNSAEYIHTSVEAIKLAMADRDTYLGDMDFIDIPYRGLLAKEYAASRRKLIDTAKASLEFRPGEVAPFAGPGYKTVNRPRDVDLAGHADHLGDTSYIATADRDRNMVSFTPSLHSGFGAKVVVGNLGFVFNCRGDYYSLVRGTPMRSSPASVRAARCRARWC